MSRYKYVTQSAPIRNRSANSMWEKGGKSGGGGVEEGGTYFKLDIICITKKKKKGLIRVVFFSPGPGDLHVYTKYTKEKC